MGTKRDLHVGGEGERTREGMIQVQLSPGVHTALEKYVLISGVGSKAAAIRMFVIAGLGVDGLGNPLEGR